MSWLSAPADPIDYLTYVSPTQEFVWEVGNKELADGLK